MIYGIEGQFGSGKTSLATFIAKKAAILTAQSIANNLSTGKSFIVSNIKFDDCKFKNYLYFEDDKFLEVFRTINFLNDLEREVYHTKRQNSSLVTWKRSNFTKFYLFYDESTAIQNANGKKELLKENGTAQEEYIMQNRKLWTDVYIIGADGNQNDKSLRRHVEWWYKVKPLGYGLSSLPFFKHFGVIERHKKDENGNILMIPYIGKDEKGDYIKKEKPCQENVDFFYKPIVWDYYDDLHKNIRDKNKSEINTQHLKYFIGQNSQLINLVKDKFPDLIDFKNEEKA